MQMRPYIYSVRRQIQFLLERADGWLHCSCPYAQRAKIVLHEKSIPHKVELFDKEQKPQDFLDLFSSITANPKARATVPTIIGEPYLKTLGNVNESPHDPHCLIRLLCFKTNCLNVSNEQTNVGLLLQSSVRHEDHLLYLQMGM